MEEPGREPRLLTIWGNSWGSSWREICFSSRGLRPVMPGICAQAESAFPTLGAWEGPGKDSCLGHIFSSELSGWLWLCNYLSPSSLQTWPCAPWAQGCGICPKLHFLLESESPWSTCPELGTTEVSWTLLAMGPCSLGLRWDSLIQPSKLRQSAHAPRLLSPPASAAPLGLSFQPAMPSLQTPPPFMAQMKCYLLFW